MLLNAPTFIDYDVLDSTQIEAKRLIEKNAYLHNHVLLAAKQTSGRGRYGRTWESQEGNLALSFVIDSDILFSKQSRFSIKEWPQLSFVMALAVEAALSSYIKDSECVLHYKWPNDILLNKKKLAGILLESFISSKKSYIIIGVGINCMTAPENTSFPATCLHAYNIILPSLKDYTKEMLEKFWYFAMRYIQEGFSFIREAWLKQAYFPSHLVTIQTMERIYRGQIQGLSETGGLILHLENTSEIYVVESGEIYYAQ